jgi:hypothetical protein
VALADLHTLPTRRANTPSSHTDTPPGSDAYQRLAKQAGALAPLVDGYQALTRKQHDVSQCGCGGCRAL